jgi:anti-sigma factor RsiW
MTSSHLSERALQAAHLRGCPLCQGRVATYQHLFTAAAHLPSPAFAFDLTARVMAQLPKAKPSFPWVLIVVVGALVLGVVGGVLALFGGALVQAFQGLATPLGAGLGVIASFLVAGQCAELLARHRRQMSLLSFS